MNLLILAVVLVNLCVANAQWGYGGYGGYGMYGMGYGLYGKRAVPATATVPPVIKGIQSRQAYGGGMGMGGMGGGMGGMGMGGGMGYGKRAVPAAATVPPVVEDIQSRQAYGGGMAGGMRGGYGGRLGGESGGRLGGGLGYGKRAAAVPPVVEGIQCAYLPETHMFSCRLGRKTVECGAVGNFSTFGYHLFGIGKFDIVRDQFFLYPRNFDNTTYLTSQFGTGTSEFVLYHGDNFVHYGVRVTDSTCFTRLADLLSTFTNFHTVTVGATEVGLIGEVLVHDITVTKRWLYGYGWGYPFGYGYGWGYPYYG